MKNPFAFWSSDDGYDRIYKVPIDGDHYYVISSCDIWLPGAYDTEESAKYALGLDYDTLASLAQRASNTSRTITLLEMKSLPPCLDCENK